VTDFAGSIKWIGATFDHHDLLSLRRSANHIPGYETDRSGLAVVALAGADIGGDEVDLVWGPDEVLGCWKVD
jgi:hypothetical protein